MASPARTLDALSDAIKGDVNRIPDPGVGGTIRCRITPSRCLLTAAGSSEARVIETPAYAGLELTLEMSSSTGDLVATNGGNTLNAAGDTDAAFSEAGDTLILRSIQIGSTYRWRVIANDGVTLSN